MGTPARKKSLAVATCCHRKQRNPTDAGPGQAALEAARVEAKAQSARLRGNGFASLETFPFQETCRFSILSPNPLFLKHLSGATA